jgi:hypothetical protein
LQQEVQAAERGIGEVRTIQTDFERRLQALQTRGSDGSTPASATDTGRQRNALVLGGWDPDTASAEMLKHAQAIVRDLRLDLDTADMFVPGVRRGLAILPLRPREGESGETMNARVREAINKVRAANVTPPGRTRSAWMTYSRTFAERRRAALAGKVKRLILQLRGRRPRGDRGRVGLWNSVVGRSSSGQRCVGATSTFGGSIHGRLDRRQRYRGRPPDERSPSSHRVGAPSRVAQVTQKRRRTRER